jgi:ribonuclease Z
VSSRTVTFLGTASQVPTRNRNHNALFLAWDGLGILFDPGEGTQRQMTHAGLSATQVTHIVLTHFHGDHCLGLAGVLQRLSLDRVPHPVPVVYPAGGQVFFDRLRYASVYQETATLVPQPLDVSAGGEAEAFRVGGLRLLARPVEHGVDCLGYRLEEDGGRRMVPNLLDRAGVRGPAVGELQRAGEVAVGDRTVRLDEVSEPRPGQAFALVTDTRPCDAAAALARAADLLVCEATYLDRDRQHAHEHYHMTAAQAADLARTSGARRLVLTHFSQRYPDHEDFHREASAAHPDVVVAADFTRVAVPPRVGG